MSIINGGLVIGMTFTQEHDLVNRYDRYLLVQHRSRRFYYLMDRLRMICPDLDALLNHFKSIGNERLVKYVKGRICRAMLIRYLDFSLYPQQYSYMGDLIFYANWVIMQGFLQRLTKVAIIHYGLKSRYYAYKIKKNDLHKISKQFAQDMLPIVLEKIVPHYHKLMDKKGTKS